MNSISTETPKQSTTHQSTKTTSWSGSLSPEYIPWFRELAEQLYAQGYECVEFSTAYYGGQLEPRFGVRIHRNGWDHSIYAKTVPEVLAQLEIYMAE